ncbi:MAG: F0F1 ATP synthase subunit A [Clostridia bacterium]|nr:F0F1 ATP synthase subunit A [Clostridia bacterium]MBQ8828114.1 F0F1 ATP synthase subunit A [Clostridia bacterium]
MDKDKKIIMIVIFAVVLALIIGTVIVKATGDNESIGELMRDAVLHETNKISLFGLKDVNPGLISAFTVTGILFVFSLIVRIFVIPKFKMVPGRFQLLLESLVGFFDNLAKLNSPHRNKFLGAYIFAAGVYIFTGTVFELFGIQVITTRGASIALPAPLADINGAVMIGCLSYLIILSGGIAGNKLKGVVRTLKEFSLPVSMSFRLFGALLSGALVTELVYHYIHLSYGLPVLVGILFTLLHALIQTYVLTMLTSLFYGEVSEPSHKIK